MLPAKASPLKWRPSGTLFSPLLQESENHEAAVKHMPVTLIEFQEDV